MSVIVKLIDDNSREGDRTMNEDRKSLLNDQERITTLVMETMREDLRVNETTMDADISFAQCTIRSLDLNGNAMHAAVGVIREAFLREAAEIDALADAAIGKDNAPTLTSRRLDANAAYARRVMVKLQEAMETWIPPCIGCGLSRHEGACEETLIFTDRH